ncbi:hypothetical protein F5B19DRAFT_493627 [Rostrohypoxylon terebratum]|nr:hypothetical protein F5B19DRAFT_493627 [Rostrohypoxylon terebratum]
MVGSRVVPKTQQRVDIRVLIAALQHRRWAVDGFHSLVIATSSDYVANAIISQIGRWLSSEWQLPMPEEVHDNRDLWQIFLSEVSKCNAEGLDVKIWHILPEITQHLNVEAERRAMEQS